jgi:succinyl-CoA synthetase beta subunit
MDLLEYQGKQLFARHGVPVSPGAPATTVDEAVSAADEIGYPVVVKAQVLIGGRGKAGGIKLAKDSTEAREHATAILGMDIRGHTVHELWIEKARTSRRVLRLLRLRPGGEGDPRDALDRGRRRHRGGRRARPGRDRPRPRRRAPRLPGLPRARARRSRPASTRPSSARSGRLLAKIYDAYAGEEALLCEVNP